MGGLAARGGRLRVRPSVREVQREPVARGCVLRSTLAGGRLGYAAMTSSTPSSRAKGSGDREWALRPHPRATVSCHLRGGPPFGTLPTDSQGGGGTRGRRAHSRSPGRRHEDGGVDAPASRAPRRCPASEARRTRVPPATCRSGARTRAQRTSPAGRERSPRHPPIKRKSVSLGRAGQPFGAPVDVSVRACAAPSPRRQARRAR